MIPLTIVIWLFVESSSFISEEAQLLIRASAGLNTYALKVSCTRYVYPAIISCDQGLINCRHFSPALEYLPLSLIIMCDGEFTYVSVTVGGCILLSYPREVHPSFFKFTLNGGNSDRQTEWSYPEDGQLKHSWVHTYRFFYLFTLLDGLTDSNYGKHRFVLWLPVLFWTWTLLSLLALPHA